MKNKKTILIALIIFSFVAIAGLVIYYAIDAKKDATLNNVKENIETEDTEEQTIDILDEINKYQEKYFEIVKRHNALLDVANKDDAVKDLKELKKLFEEVKDKIDKNCEYLKEYEKIKEKYKVNNGNNTLEMNEFQSKKYTAFDKLLNDTYKEVKLQIEENEFEKLKKSQKIWLKEVEDYNKVFEAQEFGTIGTLIKLDYEINMRSFRTLLLMLYLKNNDEIKVEDFLGNWSEISAGRIYLNIENEDNNIKVVYGGASSAYSHGESVFNCKFENSSIVCKGAKHQEQSVSCKGIRADEDMEKYLECAEKYPNEEKDDYKTYTDNKIRILKIKKGSKKHFVIDDDEVLPEERKKEIRENYENLAIYFSDDNETFYYKYKD